MFYNTVSPLLQISRDVCVAAKKERRQGGRGFGGSNSNPQNEETTQVASDRPAILSKEAVPQADVDGNGMDPSRQFTQAKAAPQSTPSSPPALPKVSRDQVLGTCVQTSALIAVMGFSLHQVAPLVSPAAYDGSADALKELLQCEYRN